jgi:ubiquinone/menaquinone biosynthesis C-methylase UbiE
LIALGGLGSLAWRYASRRSSLPCPAWLGWIVELDSPFAGTNRAQAIIRNADIQPGMKVLDVGCGPGRLAIPAAEEVGTDGEVLAIDIQPKMLRRAQERAGAASVSNIRFQQAAVGEGKLGKGQYDRALLVTVLGEIPDREAALREIFETLKPGGVLSVTEVIMDPHFQTLGTILRLARACGFREQRRFGSRFAFTLNLEKPGKAFGGGLP